MTDNIREYHTLKFFRGKRRNNAEMQRLADACMDFAYRRLLIEENELDLHVYFSRMTVFNWLSWCLLTLAFCCIQFPIVTSVFLGLAVVSRLLAVRCRKMFRFIFRSYILALAIVDSVIRQDHGLSLR